MAAPAVLGASAPKARNYTLGRSRATAYWPVATHAGKSVVLFVENREPSGIQGYPRALHAQVQELVFNEMYPKGSPREELGNWLPMLIRERFETAADTSYAVSFLANHDIRQAVWHYVSVEKLADTLGVTVESLLSADTLEGLSPRPTNL